jgi:hypothetical protein
MKPSFRAWFLIAVACVVFNLRWGSVVILVGYGLAEYFDQREERKTRWKIFNDLLFGWEPSEEGKEYEDKGGLSRVRLTGQNQIVAVRVGELLVRMR